MKTLKKSVIFFSMIILLSISSSCGAKKSGCGLTSDTSQPVKPTKTICYTPEKTMNY